MNDLGIKSVGVFIDGGYYAKIDEGFSRIKSPQRVNLKGLLSFITEHICRMDGIRPDKISITESHYYRGRYRVQDADDKNLLYEERKFEDTLIENDVVFHYKHLREVDNHGRTTVIEKGIDTWFALDTYEMAQFRKFDYTVLISGDADHEMLARKLNALKTKVVLLTWNVGPQASTSRLLKEEVGWHLELRDECAADKTLLNKICRPL